MKTRLDHLLVTRGIAATRSQARGLIMAARVLVAGQAVTKAGALVAEDAEITLKAPSSPYVSRGGEKLAVIKAALANGSYRPDSRKLANIILAKLLAGLE